MEQKDFGIKKGMGFGAAGAAIASLCCITPLVIVFFGLGSLSFALSFSKYKPFFLIAGALFVLFAILINVRKEGSACSIDPNAIKRKKYFIATIIVIMAVIYLLMQYFILPLLGKIVYA
ncbi:hypothetical protein HYU07_02370 [Candidatus Woesearchaeota archaeon]|nr:hypothetical protein [Candidatus Woesearchaeota archaeon]